MIDAHSLVEFPGGLRSFELVIKHDFRLGIKCAEEVHHGFSNQVHKATLNDKPIFIRTNKDPEIFPVEILGYEAFKEKGIPVPNVIAYEEKPGIIGYPTMIMEAANGIALNQANLTPEQEEKVYENIGNLVNKIHQIKVKGFGPLSAERGNLKGKLSTWEEYWTPKIESTYQDLVFLVDKQLLTEQEAELVRASLKKSNAFSVEESSLLHRDIHRSHVFVTGDQVSGVIDLGLMIAGDPRYDIAYSFMFQNEQQQEAFIKGYGNLAYDPAVNIYLIAIAIGKARFRYNNGLQEGAEKAVDKLRQALYKISSG
jgi:aminoglycoside phosphotransferase (APT) family kinase protein